MAPVREPASGRESATPSDMPSAGEPAPASEAGKRLSVPQSDANADEQDIVKQNPQQQRAQLERRLQAVMNCLEAARLRVVAAEVAGAGIEAMRPAIDALARSEAALREAQAQLIHGEADRAAPPLERAEESCRVAREFSHQT